MHEELAARQAAGAQNADVGMRLDQLNSGSDRLEETVPQAC